MHESHEFSSFSLSRTPSLTVLASNQKFQLVIRELHESSQNLSSVLVFLRTSFSISHQTMTFHTFFANLKKILYIRLCHLASFNVLSHTTCLRQS